MIDTIWLSLALWIRTFCIPVYMTLHIKGIYSDVFNYLIKTQPYYFMHYRYCQHGHGTVLYYTLCNQGKINNSYISGIELHFLITDFCWENLTGQVFAAQRNYVLYRNSCFCGSMWASCQRLPLCSPDQYKKRAKWASL